MRQLKPVIQDSADRINEPLIDSNISAIKAMVAIDKNTKEAIKAYKEKQESILQNNVNENIIVTADDMRKAMNREIEL